ncbi:MULTISPECIES: HAD family hydrolase [Prauserella salsuginis group]|uniref:HAD family hydrolase n=1 Tax=Prauserella salsuginis TaxID=387889 RepID=A0ABW6G7E0_9PSEU|nr:MULTISPECIES: HAD family hydrolase [Prauserella salsuginis group]
MLTCVGFDLDMTLIDPRPGMVAAMNRLGEDNDLPLDGEQFAAHLGPPLDQALRGFGAPEERIPDLITQFRTNYPDIVIPRTVALPGAKESLETVRELGATALVVTGKYGPNADLHVKSLDLPVDRLVGDLWSTGKAEALIEHGATVYVGDHIGDMYGARAAGAVAVGVVTGPCSRDELVEAGAEVVLGSLTELPDWLRGAFT